MQFKLIVKAQTDQPDSTNDELHYRTKHHTKRHAHDAALKDLPTKDIDTIRKPDGTDDDTNIINHWRESIKGETPHRLLDASDDGSDCKDKWVDSDHPHHTDRQCMT